MYYKLLCILYALLCGQNFILVKSGCYTDVVFLHLVGCVGQVVHFGASWSETSMHHVSCSGGTSMDFTISALRDVMLNGCFFIRWDLQVT
jgi:hypothetical protein